MKTKRKIIKIDEDKCNGCGLCIPGCPEGALQIVETEKGPKAKLVKENFCDGLGACLGECPEDALKIEEHEVEEYDEKGVIAHIKKKHPDKLKDHLAHQKKHADELPKQHSHETICACPSAQMQKWDKKDKKETEDAPKIHSELRQWPIQLHLVSPMAPYFKNADFALVADCVPFAYANFHSDFMKNKALAIACPKLDNIEPYIEKIKQIIQVGEIKSLTVVHMEVPCCFGIVQIAKKALEESGKKIELKTINISIKGEISN